MNFFTRLKYKLKRIYYSYSVGDYMRVSYLSPRQVVLVTTRFNGKDNVIPVDWHIPLSFSPKLYAVCLENSNYTSEMISSSGCFAVNFVSSELEEKVLQCGKISGRENDKFALTGLQKTDAQKINAPILNDSIGFLECELMNKIVTGDHTLFIGKVLTEKEAGKFKRLFHTTS